MARAPTGDLDHVSAGGVEHQRMRPARPPRLAGPPDVAARSTAGPRTVLIGCSFAGLEFLYRYARRQGRFRPGELVVVDPHVRHMYTPLLHEAVSGRRGAEALVFDAEGFCRDVGGAFMPLTAVGLEPNRRTVALDDGTELGFERLIVAVGSVPAVPPDIAAREEVFAPKWLPDAVRLRERLLALRAAGAQRIDAVVVGAGVTGVEWAAELAGAGVHVTLVGRAPELLPRFHRGVAAHAARVLRALGARTVLGRGITSVDAGRVVLDDGSAIRAEVVVWAGGVRPAPLLETLGLPLTESGQLAVTPRLAVAGYENIYGIGDAVRIVEDGVAWPTMVRAIESIWQGATLADRLGSGWIASEGPAHRLRRDFFYGISLGPGHSMIVAGRWWSDSAAFVLFRRWLEWAYYARYRAVAGLRAGSAPVSRISPAPALPRDL
jgi:NADH dehydrogenase